MSEELKRAKVSYLEYQGSLKDSPILKMEMPLEIAVFKCHVSVFHEKKWLPFGTIQECFFLHLN